MRKKTKDFSLSSRSLKYKLKIGFYLMSILPLLVSIYLASNYIIPRSTASPELIIFMLISVLIALAGFFVLKEVFDRIIALTGKAKIIASGDITQRIEAGAMDEVGDLGDALNKLAARIRSNMEELKVYSEKTTEINIEIQKRVLVLSSLMQISSLISQGRKLDEIAWLTVEKSLLLANSDCSYLLFKEEDSDVFFMKMIGGASCPELLELTAESTRGLFDKVIRNNKVLIVDETNQALRKDFQEKFKFNNTLAQPVLRKGRVVAILGVGNNREQFSYKKDDTDLLEVFAKQVAISIENEYLIRKVESLEIRDSLTGLYNLIFIRNRLDEEIRRAIAYHRPCAFVFLHIDNFQEFHSSFGLMTTENALKKAASLVQDSVTEIDRVGRIGDNAFAVILPEKNKRQALDIAQQIRKNLEFGFSEETNPGKKFLFSIGISENPLDGVTADELIANAKLSLASQ
ncbi:MAG: diguanylate cyclase [Candidatus Omnitrophica bacterium]|nr:diguanylate cyclase [Candidatus Omnitrophota bacterium]